ncbi:MAG: zinc ribbon domain-containing protein [Butyrivibrio sp.]|nr:zinc ribbon domain-containing protein [Butyrivibrio sp.]
MRCKACGTENSDTRSFCSNCGQPLLGDEVVTQQPTMADGNGGVFSGNVPTGNPEIVYTGSVETIGPKMSKAEFFKMPQFNQPNSTINGWTIFMIIVGILNLVLELAFGLIPIDGVLILGLGIALRKTKSVGVAVTILIVGILSVIYGLFTSGTPAGAIHIVGGAILSSVTTKMQNSYDNYLKTGTISFE